MAFLILFNSQHELILFEHLNIHLHHPNLDNLEGQRARSVSNNNHLPAPFEHIPGLWRLGDGLAVSRALGDLKSEPYGLSHEP